jgi:four helix bundle protein
LAGQLVRCGTSIGANAEEAEEAQTKLDFIAELSICRKEAREAKWWLRLAIQVQAVSRQEVEWELDEAGQLLVMIRSAILTARKSSARGES